MPSSVSQFKKKVEESLLFTFVHSHVGEDGGVHTIEIAKSRPSKAGVVLRTSTIYKDKDGKVTACSEALAVLDGVSTNLIVGGRLKP